MEIKDQLDLNEIQSLKDLLNTRFYLDYYDEKDPEGRLNSLEPPGPNEFFGISIFL